MNTAGALRVYAAICAAIGVLPLANWLTAGRGVPWYGIAVREWLARGGVVLAIAVLLAILLGDRLDVFWARARSILLVVPATAFAFGIAVAAFLAALVLTHWSFAGLPFTSDEMAQQWHARVLASGRLSAITEENPEFFNTAPVFDRGSRWFSQYPIGGPAFIAVGVLVNAPWLVNPVLIAIATWMLYRFLDDAFDETTARVTSLLWIASPMVLIMSASQMNHVPALAFTLVSLRVLWLWDREMQARRRALYAAIIGLSIGVVALVRPLDATVVAVVVGAFQLWRVRALRARFPSLGFQIMAGAIPVAILLWANARTTGGSLHFAYEALNGPEHAIGFHVDPNGVAHTPRRGLAFVSGYLLRLSRYLFEWPLPGMAFVVLGIATVAKRATRWDVLLAALSAAILVAYGAYWFDGFFAGPRFLFTALPVFAYFAARAPGVLSSFSSPVARRAMTLVLPLCVLAAWLIPSGVSSASGRVGLYREQRDKLKTDVDAQLERAGIQNALVLVQESWRGRLLARLRVLGMSQFRAERTVNTTDACALQTALDAEDTLTAIDGTPRTARIVATARAFGQAQLVPGLDADQALALVPGSTPTPRCLAEFQQDTAGTIPYAIFLARQRVGPDGRIGGDIVFARDLGERNELLRRRFGDRTWYRYRTPSSLADTAAVFLPYVH
jgi:hypothetical protein